MAATILLLIAFQLYWMRKLYGEEKDNFKKTTDVVFRDAMYRMQVQRFSGDSMALRSGLGDNLFMADFISSFEKIKGDSLKQRLVISMDTHSEQIISHDEKDVKKRSGDTLVYVSATKKDVPPPPFITEELLKNKKLSDSLPVKAVDSIFRALLLKEGIHVPFRIIKTDPVMLASDSGANSFTIKLNETGNAFSTRRIPVGLLKPVFYRAEFDNPGMHLLKKMGMQLFLSLLLIGFTILSFVFIYRSLLAQKKLTDIKNEFIGNITHELKTPIATVSVAIEAMKNFNALQNPERTKEYLNIAGLELNRLSLLVDKVLRLSMFEMKYEWFDLKDLVNEVTKSMQLQFEKYGAVVQTDFEGDDFSLMADRMHISSVVYNLLDNALKYSKGKPQIRISLQAKDNGLQLSIKDNGIGIPVAYREKIFDKFFRVPQGDTHNVKGYGLGLSYVAHIIAKHGGRVTVQSGEEGGTSFIIKLPKENGSS
jgi:two-component system, OmpR family, phosphate regulon sensor histidine kinase PhoR